MRIFCLLAAGALPLPALAQPQAQTRAQVEEVPADPVVTVPGVPVPAEEADPSEANVAGSTAPPVNEETSRAIDINVWGRLGNNIRSATGSTNAFVDAEVDLLLGGSVHPKIGWQADFVATYGPGNFGPGADNSGRAQILDLIVKFEVIPELNVWFGRMLVPSDRSTNSGPWFMSAWNYPGGYIPGAVPIGPRTGAFGRSDGVTVWGQVEGGLLKYFGGVYDLGAPTDSPLFSGRLNLSLGNPEPGYYHSSTYYGGRDLAAIGVSAQYKKRGSLAPPPVAPDMVLVPPADYTGFSADFLLERTSRGRGTFDLEGAVYVFAGDYEPVTYHYYALASYLVARPFGFGRLQPMVRFQQAKPASGAGLWSIFDLQVGYAVQEHAARVALGYQRIDALNTDDDMFFLGIQIQR